MTHASDKTPAARAAPRTFLGMLRNDAKGNVLAMMAIFLIPLTGLAGSAVDVGRLYLVKVRLQQACDAGALAGRKFMADTNDSNLDVEAAKQARTFFASNFPTGLLGTPAYSDSTTPYPFTPSKTADNQVAGTASVEVPMTLMRMFSAPTRTVAVTCEARYDVADTDIMFVLDTTGSMACAAADTSGCSPTVGSYTRPDGSTGYYATEKSNSKLSGLRSAVMSFYDSLAANVDPSTHVRYGFVTYTSTVNAGYALPANSFVSKWTYPSRSPLNDVPDGGASSNSTQSTTQATCTSRNTGRVPATGYANDGTATVASSTWTSDNGGTCTTTTQRFKYSWRYQDVQYDVSAYVTGATVDDPSKITAATSKWQGCIEERDTDAGETSFDQNNLPPDLDPDLAPTTDATRWRPMWPDVIYYRGNNTSLDYSGNSSNPYGDSTSNSQGGTYTNMLLVNNIASGYVSCGKPVSRLKSMDRAAVSAYVNDSDFKAQGGTYHDTGMIWGTRMISPKGIFAADTAAWPGRNSPNRYIVFMTDGDMAPNASIYGMYGMERYAKRVSGGDTNNLLNYHNQRFVAECTAAKARGITVFVIGFGQTLTSQLTTCASPGQAYYASDNAALTTAFEQIAKQVAMLRVSK